jgi:hypothetical protein
LSDRLRGGPTALRIGGRTKEMELVAEFFGKRHGITCNSGSSAHYLAIELLGLSEGLVGLRVPQVSEPDGHPALVEGLGQRLGQLNHRVRVPPRRKCAISASATASAAIRFSWALSMVRHVKLSRAALATSPLVRKIRRAPPRPRPAVAGTRRRRSAP